MRNNSLLLHSQESARTEIRKGMRMRERDEFSKCHRASEGQLSQSVEWFIKAEESTTGRCGLQIGAPSLSDEESSSN